MDEAFSGHPFVSCLFTALLFTNQLSLQGEEESKYHRIGGEGLIIHLLVG